MPKPLPGGTRWTQDGIEASKAFWVEANAYREAISGYLSHMDPRKTPREIRDDLLPLINGLTDAMVGLRHALYELEIIGIEAKRERLDNGETSHDQT